MNAVVRSTRPLGALVALVIAGMLTTRTVDIAPGDTLSEIAVAHDVSVEELARWNDVADPDLILAGDTLIVQLDGADGSSYVVRPGDTLSSLSRRFETSVSNLAEANGLSDPDRILSGQVLSLVAAAGPEPASPATSSTYVVRLGDTLSAVARALGVRVAALMDANDLGDPDRIIAGVELQVPGTADPSPPTSEPPTTTVAPPTTTTAPSPTTTTAAPPTTTAAAPTEAAPPSTSVPSPAPGSGTGLAPFFERWAAAYGVDRSLLEAVLWVESGWRADLVGSGERVGIAQLAPGTVEFIEERLLGLDLDPLDASDGIQLAARYLRYVVDRTVDARTAVAAWRQGLSDVTRNGVSGNGGSFADDVLAIRDQRS